MVDSELIDLSRKNCGMMTIVDDIAGCLKWSSLLILLKIYFFKLGEKCLITL